MRACNNTVGCVYSYHFKFGSREELFKIGIQLSKLYRVTAPDWKEVWRDYSHAYKNKKFCGE